MGAGSCKWLESSSITSGSQSGTEYGQAWTSAAKPRTPLCRFISRPGLKDKETVKTNIIIK